MKKKTKKKKNKKIQCAMNLREISIGGIYISLNLIKALSGHNLLLPWPFVSVFTCLKDSIPIIQLVLTLRLVTYTLICPWRGKLWSASLFHKITLDTAYYYVTCLLRLKLEFDFYIVYLSLRDYISYLNVYLFNKHIKIMWDHLDIVDKVAIPKWSPKRT